MEISRFEFHLRSTSLHSIGLVAFDNVPQTSITVTVPTGDAVYNKATKKFDIRGERGSRSRYRSKNMTGTGKRCIQATERPR